MKNAHKKLMAFVRDVSGATVVEYTLIAGIISMAIVAGATTIGQSANSSFEKVDQEAWGG